MLTERKTNDWRLAAEICILLDQFVRKVGGRRVRLSPKQEKVLEALARGPIDALDDLAHDVGASRPTVSRMLDRLEKRDYVRRAANPEDRRRWVFEITDDGRKALETPVSFDPARVLEAVPEDRRLACRNLLHKARFWPSDGTEIRRELKQLRDSAGG